MLGTRSIVPEFLLGNLILRPWRSYKIKLIRKQCVDTSCTTFSWPPKSYPRLVASCIDGPGSSLERSENRVHWPSASCRRRHVRGKVRHKPAPLQVLARRTVVSEVAQMWAIALPRFARSEGATSAHRRITYTARRSFV